MLNITLPAEFSTSSRAVRPAAGERVYHNVLQPISTLVPYVANYVCRLVNMMRNRSKLIRSIATGYQKDFRVQQMAWRERCVLRMSAVLAIKVRGVLQLSCFKLLNCCILALFQLSIGEQIIYTEGLKKERTEKRARSNSVWLEQRNLRSQQW